MRIHSCLLFFYYLTFSLLPLFCLREIGKKPAGAYSLKKSKLGQQKKQAFVGSVACDETEHWGELQGAGQRKNKPARGTMREGKVERI